MNRQLVLMGKVLGAFGLRGEIRVFYYGQEPELLSRAGQIWLGAEPGVARPYTVEQVRGHKGRMLLKTEQVVERNGASALAGKWLYVSREALPELARDEFYWFELKGALVQDTSGRELGRVIGISNNGAQDLMEIKGGHAMSALIPLIKPILQNLDIEQGLVIVDIPPGLLEAQGWTGAADELTDSHDS